MKYFLLSALLFAICFSSCQTQPQQPKVDFEKDVAEVSSDDAEMNAAIAKARSTLGDFEKAFTSHLFDSADFVLKVRFPASGNYEHMWVSDLAFKDGHFTGTVEGNPEMTTIVKSGERITVPEADITDWMYSDHGIMRGGYTMRVLRNKLSPAEQAQLDSTLGLKIEAE